MAEITGQKLFGLGNYTTYFYDNIKSQNKDQVRIDNKYYRMVEDDVYDNFCILEEENYRIDTALEWALASYYSPAVVQIRPPEAAAILPENNRESPLKLAAAVLYKLAEVKFLTPQDTAAVGRYEGMVKFIQDKHGLTRAEIDKYYSDALRAEVTNAVNKEFYRLPFSIKNETINNTYDAILTINLQTGYYSLSYDKLFNSIIDTTIEDAPTLEALLAEMRKRPKEFDRRSIADVQENAPKIPGVVYAERKAKGEADALALITDALVNLYTNPTQDNYKIILGIDGRYSRVGSPTQSANFAYWDAMKSFSPNLYNKFINDPDRNRYQWNPYPADRRYDVFGK